MRSRRILESSRQLDTLFKSIFYCPSCTNWRLARTLTKSQHYPQSSKRNASTWSSRTAINASKPVPPDLRLLYDGLAEVRKNAASHVNTSRLSLAIQGLESKSPTIRLAVLGLNVPDTARRVARLLLVDPLEDEEPWENNLVAGHDDYSRGLIIRYGQPESTGHPRPKNSIPVLSIPASVLERHNIEILVSSVNGPNIGGPSSNVGIPADTFLSPVVGTPTSFDGRQTIISQPVHQTILVANGIDQLLAASQLLASVEFSSNSDRDSIHVAVNLSDVSVSTSDGNSFIVNTKSAEEGLAAIRTSIKQATKYEHKWMASGMSPLSQWLLMSAASKASSRGTLPQPIRSLISAVLDAASKNLKKARLSAAQAAMGRGLSSAEQYSLGMAIDEFSRAAHQELQSGLASAWSSRNWRKLAWYKLFWRVDDVGLIVTDLVTSTWLPRTERAVYELSGRLLQLGINPVIESELGDTQGKVGTEEPQPADGGEPTSGATERLAAASESLLMSQLSIEQAAYSGTAAPAASITAFAQVNAATATPPTPTAMAPTITNPKGTAPEIGLSAVAQPKPLTSTMSTARTAYINETTVTLTSTAQQLVLRTLSLTGLTGGLSGLTFISELGGTWYEAGTIFAAGTVFALWRMQTSWMKACRKFESRLFLQGRTAILDMTNQMRRLVDIKVKRGTEIDPVEKQALDRAEHAIDTARKELDKL